ncbi:MAG TPA: FkbM family methyltransferase [Bosea sp. (in: a-proteobacteria)]
MNSNLRKAIRTAQSYLPFLKSSKDEFYRRGRRLLRTPHDKDFAVISKIDFSNGIMIDVGANHGQSIETAKLYRPDISIVSFEPNIILANALIERYRGDGKVEIRPIGLADCSGSFELHVPSYRGYVYDGLASLDRTEAEGWLSPDTIYGFRESNLKIDTHLCSVETLDEQDLRPSFIKIDVQGFELQVLIGAKNTLEQFKPAIMLENGSRNSEIMDFLSKYDYRQCYVDNDKLVDRHTSSENSVFITKAHEYLCAKP